MIHVGDWVTQYSAGYWKVLDIIPKYAEKDFHDGDKFYKKGECIGNWVILKKGFTSKLKPSNLCEFVDAQWCKPVSESVRQSIEIIFDENVKIKQKFDNASNIPKPSILSIWMKLSDEEADLFIEQFKKMPDKFTEKQFWELAEAYRKCVVEPSSATHILYLFSYLWEVNENFEPLHFAPKFERL